MFKRRIPVVRTAATFDTVEPIDIRFRQNAEGVWRYIIKYELLSDAGESNGFYEDKGLINNSDIRKLDNLIAKLTKSNKN